MSSKTRLTFHSFSSGVGPLNVCFPSPTTIFSNFSTSAMNLLRESGSRYGSLWGAILRLFFISSSFCLLISSAVITLGLRTMSCTFWSLVVSGLVDRMSSKEEVVEAEFCRSICFNLGVVSDGVGITGTGLGRSGGSEFDLSVGIASG